MLAKKIKKCHPNPLTFLQIGPYAFRHTLTLNYYNFDCEKWSKHFYKLDPMPLDTLLPYNY